MTSPSVSLIERPFRKRSPLGAFFTPLQWTKWVVSKNGLFTQWLNGAVVFDPTAGEGNFLEAFVSTAIDEGVEIRDEMLGRLLGVEKEKRFVESFFSKMKRQYGVDFSVKNFINSDFILSGNTTKADIVVGNPPWQNFNDLPPLYKEKLKPYFFRYHLIPDTKQLLLGGSRIDIAALVIAKCLVENVKEHGSAYFFMPLSILLNDSAHRSFRSYSFGPVKFSIEEVYDFKNNSVFEEVATRYGLAKFQRDKKQKFPIPYLIFESGQWSRKLAKPTFNSDDPLSIVEDDEHAFRAFDSFSKINIPLRSKPRQGVNTCGGNNIFIFDSIGSVTGNAASFSNKVHHNVELPLKYLFPMVTKDNFGQAEPTPQRFVLLPYNPETGKPLEEFEIARERSLHDYLLSHKTWLQQRKGTLINVWISKGYWWALLGVGKYSFSPHKIVWEAYGRDTFLPKIFSGKDSMCWQGNQALHAYIPTENSAEAAAICARLRNPVILQYLLSQQMEGTCNWAQPGRVSKLLEFADR